MARSEGVRTGSWGGVTSTEGRPPGLELGERGRGSLSSDGRGARTGGGRDEGTGHLPRWLERGPRLPEGALGEKGPARLSGRWSGMGPPQLQEGPHRGSGAGPTPARPHSWALGFVLGKGRSLTPCSLSPGAEAKAVLPKKEKLKLRRERWLQSKCSGWPLGGLGPGTWPRGGGRPGMLPPRRWCVTRHRPVSAGCRDAEPPGSLSPALLQACDGAALERRHSGRPWVWDPRPLPCRGQPSFFLSPCPSGFLLVLFWKIHLLFMMLNTC